MFYIIVGTAVMAAIELPGMIKRKSPKEIVTVSVICAIACYYAVTLALHFVAYSPFYSFMMWLDEVGISYSKLLSS